MVITAKGDTLIVRQPGGEQPLQKIADLEFMGTGGVRVVFVADSSGAIAFRHLGGRSWRKIVTVQTRERAERSEPRERSGASGPRG